MTRRYWDAQSNTWIEAQVVWGGVGPLPGQVCDGTWRQRGVIALLDYAPGAQASPSQREVSAAPLVAGTTSPGDTVVTRAPRAERGRCRSCYRIMARALLTWRYALCPDCRGGRPRQDAT